jgi:hypothetical protein
MTDDRHARLLRPTAAEAKHLVERAPWDLSAEAEAFIESAKVLAEPYQEEIATLRAELGVLRAQRDAALAACDERAHRFAGRSADLAASVRAALGLQPEGN